jgi:hypothetical protein
MSTIWPTTAENPQSASAACAPSEEAPAGPGEEFGFAAFTATELKEHSEGIARMISTDVKRPFCGSQEKTAIGDRWSVNSEQLTAITRERRMRSARFRKNLESGKNHKRSKSEL